MSRKSILVVDDEPKMRELVSVYLKKEDYHVVTVGDGVEALNELEKGDNFNLYIIDVMMPNMDGFSLCKEIRRFSQKPIIFLTARGEEYERLLGFEIGADDYIVKPFSPREMLARVNAVLKRTDSPLEAEGIKTYGEITIDVKGREVKVGEEKLSFSPKEFDLLVYLVKNSGIVLSREQITENVWDYEYFGDQRTVDTHIKKLREKLGEKAEKYIKTVWGVGYKFEVD